MVSARSSAIAWGATIMVATTGSRCRTCRPVRARVHANRILSLKSIVINIFLFFLCHTCTDSSKANCINYPPNVMCCAFDGRDDDIEVPDVDDVDPVASVSIDVQFVLGGCRHAVMQAATSFGASDGFREPLSATSSQALSLALPRLQRAYPSVDFNQAIRNLPVYKCTTNCGNGRCVDGACVCPPPFTGAMCTDKLPSKVTVSNIIPGGKGTDVWMFGTKRTIEVFFIFVCFFGLFLFFWCVFFLF